VDAQADFIELRLDDLRFSRELSCLANHRTPIIATDHSRKDPLEKQDLLLDAAESGFEYVDVDLQTPKLQNLIGQIKSKGTRVIVSAHDYNKTPTLIELNRILERQVSSGADVFKIVTTANRMEDNLTLLQFIQSAPTRKKPVCFAMGELGRMSRLMSPVFGSFFTFAALEEGNETALGQMTIQEMRQAYDLLRL